MGHLTLANFRTRMSRPLGNRTGLTDEEKNLWINAGYFDLVGAVKFEKFRDTLDVSLDPGEDYFEHPLYVLGIEAVHQIIYDEERPLLYTDLRNFNRHRQIDSVDELRTWTLNGNVVLLNAPPTSGATLRLEFYREPDRLEADGDKTVLASTWDEAVHRFAVAKAFLDLGEHAKAKSWEDFAAEYVGSRLDDTHFGEGKLSEGVHVATSSADLTRRRYG